MDKDLDKKKDTLNKAKKTAAILSISLFLFKPITSGQIIKKNDEIKKEGLAIEFTDKIPKPRYFYQDFEEWVKKDQRIKKKTTAILSSRQIDSKEALEIIDKINMENKELAIKILREISDLEASGKIRTSPNLKVIINEDDVNKMKEEIRRLEKIPYAVSITYYPSEKTIVLRLIEKIEIKSIKLEKGEYLIIDENGIKIEK